MVRRFVISETGFANMKESLVIVPDSAFAKLVDAIHPAYTLRSKDLFLLGADNLIVSEEGIRRIIGDNA